MTKASSIFLFLVFGCALVFGQVQPDPRVLVKQAGAVANDLLQWDGTKWAPGRTDVAVVADSAAFRAFNVAIAPKLIVMTDSLRGGKFRRCYSCSADQYMTFSDALSRKWERFDYFDIYPEWFGAKGDSTNSDNVAFRKSFEYIRGNHVSILRLKDRKYVVSGLVTNTFSTTTNKSVSIIGSSKTMIVNKSIVAPFQFLNAPISLTLSQNQVADKNWVRCSGISTLVPGDIIFIKSSEIAETGWNYPVNDQHVINRIGGDTLFLRNNLNFNYTTGAIVEFIAYKARSINISNIQFLEDATAVEGVVYTSGFRDSEFRNISTKYNIVSSGIVLAPQIRCYRGVDQTFENMAIHNSQYGIDVSSSRNSIVNNITGSYSWGLVVPASWSDGVFINGLTGNNVTLDGHPAFNVSYKNVDVIDAGVSIRSLGVTVENLKLFNKDSTTYGYCIFEMSGLLENPYKYKVPRYPTTLKNVQLLSATKNTTFHTVDINSTHYNIDGLTANAIFITRKTNLNSVENIRTGHVRVWKPNIQFRSMILDGSISPTWVTGFLLMDQSNINIDGLKVRNASAKTLFSSADPSNRMYISNSTLDTLLSIGNSSAASNLNSVVLENCQLKNFGSTSNNNAQFHNVTYDATVLSSINPEKNNLAFNNFTSNEYQRTGIVIENTQNSGIPQLDLYGGPATAELSLKGGTGVLSLLNLYNDNGRLDLGVTISAVPTQKIRVDYNGNVGIGGVSAPSEALHVGGSLRVTGTIKDSNNEAGTAGQILSSTGTATDWVTASDNNGIYSGSGTIPNNTNATATDDFTITTADATGTQSPKFRVVASGTDPGVQVWKVGNDSLQLSFIGGEPTLEAIGTSGDFWINSIGNDVRIGNGSTGVFTHTTKNVLGGYLAVPYVQTASSITVSEGTAEVDVVGTAGTITLTFDNTSNLLGSAAKTITVRNRGAFNVTLSRGSQSWQWSDFTGTNTASDQTLAPGETAKMLWVDAGVTDYYVLHKMPATFTGSPANLAISGTSSPLTVTNSNGTGFTLTAGTNLTLSGTSGNVTINATTQQAYTTVQEEGSSVTQRTLLNFVGSAATAADNTTKTDITFDSDVNALASTATTGLYTVTGTGASATRTITAPASGISISNGDGVSGNPTLALANDLSAVEGLSANGVAVRTGTDTWAVRTITAGTGISISNGDGVSGNPTISSTAGGETVISPSSLSTDQNNWNPTDLSTATIIRMTSSVNLLMITGITAPAAAKKLVLVNIGSNTFILTAQDVNSSAANRFQMTSDFPLYPGTSVTILYDLTSAVWRILEQDRDTKSQRGREFGVEWVAMGSTAPHGCSLFTSNTSVGNPSATLNAGQDLSPGAGSYSYALIGAPSSPTVTPFFVSSSSRTSSVHDFTITTPSSLSNATDSYSLSFGIFNDQIASEPDGVYLFYNHSVNSGKWLGYTNGNSTSTIDTGVTVAASTTYQLRVIIRPDGSVAYFIDDVYVGKTTTNIPAGQGMFGGARINKLAGTSRTLVYRYINARQFR